ncbi:MAG: hypothetical protein D6806_09900 [Deltaproteobacteria bacterium]|nr:MAG: hypothetical protein D6806_09900 [Deltaproteobacteria bacterium]
MRLRSKRGNALLVSVLLLLSLTAVGLVSMSRTGADLSVSGNVLRAGQAWQVAEAGNLHTLAYVRKYLWEVVTKLQIVGRQNVTSGMQALSGVKMFTTSSSTSSTVKHLPFLNPGGTAEQIERAHSLQAAAYSVTAMPVASLERRDVPGFETEEICFEVFEMDARAAKPASSTEDINTTLDPSSRHVTKARLRAVLGPFKCQLR